MKHESDWIDKANRIIGGLCYESFILANKTRNGRRRKQHRPYSVPDTARQLIECIGRNDENEAKAIFIGMAMNPCAYR